MPSGVGVGLRLAQSRIQKVLPRPSLGFDADLAAHHVDHPLGDREAESEALALERAAAAIEALEDAIALLRGNPRPVSSTSITTLLPLPRRRREA